MAKKTAKKKSAKKKGAIPAAARKAVQRMHDGLKKDGLSATITAGGKTATLGAAPSRPAIQKMLDPEAFPERNPRIEELIVGYLEAVKSEDAATRVAKDRTKTAHAALKEEIRANGLDYYSSYDIREVVELKPLDEKLIVRAPKKGEAVACGPPASEDDEDLSEADDDGEASE